MAKQLLRPLAAPLYNHVVFMLIEQNDENPLHKKHTGGCTRNHMLVGSGGTIEAALQNAVDNHGVTKDDFYVESPVVDVWMLDKDLSIDNKSFTYVGVLRFSLITFTPAN